MSQSVNNLAVPYTAGERVRLVIDRIDALTRARIGEQQLTASMLVVGCTLGGYVMIKLPDGRAATGPRRWSWRRSGGNRLVRVALLERPSKPGTAPDAVPMEAKEPRAQVRA